MTTQDKWWAGAVASLFLGFILIATHDRAGISIAAGNIQSVLGYIIGIAGTLFCLYKVSKNSKQIDG